MIDNADISNAMKIHLEKIFRDLPEMPAFVPGVRRASKRSFTLNQTETALALKNALRYIPEKWHEKLAPEFLDELLTMGRIYGYRFRPPEKITGRPIDEYQGNCLEGKAFQVMIDNNLDV
ncbi:MAG: urocanate hydratase, partial [Deltaproteobacteria bacterium]|nr:urocanate hydratase [Deltaproteobacteria bacterium]